MPTLQSTCNVCAKWEDVKEAIIATSTRLPYNPHAAARARPTSTIFNHVQTNAHTRPFSRLTKSCTRRCRCCPNIQTPTAIVVGVGGPCLVGVPSHVVKGANMTTVPALHLLEHEGSNKIREFFGSNIQHTFIEVCQRDCGSSKIRRKKPFHWRQPAPITSFSLFACLFFNR